MSDEELGQLIEDENLLEQFIVGTVSSGIAQSGLVPGMTNGSLKEANATGRDFVTGLNQNEQSVIDKVYNDTITEKEKSGKKLSNREKNRIYEDIISDMDNGQISIDDIEEVLGGSTFEEYKSLTEKEKSLTDEISQLESMFDNQITVKQRERLTEARKELENLTGKTELKTKLSDEVYGIAKNSRLAESYNEKARKSEAFKADLSKYKGKQREAVERAIRSGVLNNTYKSHILVDTLSKIEADKGIVFNYADNAKLKETGFVIEGKTVNGFVKDGTVTLNIQSAKAWQSVVGHEITHVLEGSEHYETLQQALFKYAESNGELASRKSTLTELYKDMDADIDAELTADLVGDYLFSDSKFIKGLTTNKNLFQKIYDEIKYLCKVATGKQLTEIEKVKQEFDKVWKELSVETKKATDNKVTYSVSQVDDITYVQTEKNTFLKEDGTLATEKEVFDSLVGKTIPLPDGEVKIVKSLPKKNMYKELYKRQPKFYQNVEDVKQLNSEVNYNMNELLSNSEMKKANDPDKDMRHAEQGIVDFDTRTVKFYDGKNAYTIEFSIGNLQNGEKIAYAKKFFGYDAELTKKIQAAETRGLTNTPMNQQPVSDDILTENGNDVKPNLLDSAETKSVIAPVKNSLSYEGEQPSSTGTPLQDLYLAPTQEDIAENATTTFEDDIAPMPTDADAPFPDEISPMTEKEANALQDEKSKVDANAEGQPKTRKQLHHNIIENIKSVFKGKGFDFDEILKKAKDLSTFSTVDNTPQRVMEKALGYKEGQVLADLTVNKVAKNETEGIKWINSFTDRKNGLLAQISRQYNIKPASKESAAAQMYAEGFYVDENNDIIAYGDTELAKDFPDIKVRNNIKGLAKDPRIRKIYDETLNAINESRTRNAYPEIQKLDNYFLHFRAMEDTFSKIGLPFNPNDIKAKDLPTDLNGVTADLKPGQPYFASAMHRTGKRTSFDLLGGLERYLTSAKNQIYHIDDIQTLRALRNHIADTYGQANGLEGIDVLSEEEAQEKIEQVYGSHLSTFAKFLNEEANVIAGKTALIDRGLEGVIGRRGMTFMDSVRKQVGSNMVGLNVSSSMTNLLAGVQAIAKTSKSACVKSLAQTTASKIGSIFGKTDSFVENNPTIIRRKGAERFYRTPFQKVGDAGYVLMSAVDNVTTEFIVRAKYNEFIKKGMSEEQAINEADKWTSRLMGDRSLGQMPQLYNSKTLGLITQFQLEVRNQLDSQFYDTIQEAKASNEDIQNGLAKNAKTAAKVTKTFFELAVLQHLFGVGFETVAGYNPAFDIISVITTALGFDDDDESEDTALDNIEQGFLELLGDLPYANLFTDGGRIPISSALPVKELVTGKDEYGNEKSRLDTMKEAAPYYFLPTGYGQIKKTYQGLSMFDTDEDHPVAGSYTDSGNLRFPVDDTLGNRIQAGIFGQYANENAREYFDNDYAPLKEKQIQEYVDVELPIADYWKYREGLKGLKKTAEKADYINSLDIEDWQKNLLMNNILDRKEDVDMSNYDDYSSFEEFDYAQKNPEKYSFFKANGISYEDYANADEDGKSAYTWAYNNPEKYTLSKAITNDVIKYKQYTGDMYDIKADKDENGKSISGSRKEKVINYINNLNADYETKIILFKSEYPSDDTYNQEIINYLNNRADLTYDELVTIYTELGFTVKNGYVYWD